ncbi:MAG: branched-chain amino acid ABC transporter permease [Chloroflexi bacterium]|nr:branched-chain amino acid ABC transporter permease [Chloroflexota bacterium]
MRHKMLSQVILNGIVLGATIALMAIGLTLIFGILRLINFAHGEFYMLGAVVSFYLIGVAGVPNILSLVLAIIAIGLLGWISSRLVFRRFYGNLIGGCLAALALLLIFRNVTWMIFGPSSKTIPTYVSGQVQIFGAAVTAERLLIVGAAVAAILILGWFIKYTRLGKSVRAVQQDGEAALVQGISVKFVSGLSVGIATALAALGGALLAPLSVVSPGMGATPLVFAFIAVIIGGMGSTIGTLLAGFIIGFQQSFTSSFLGPQFSLGVSFGLAMLMLAFRPRGLMGHA